MSNQLWDVVGGGAKGGIVVRTGKELASPETSERLATGARVKELELIDERLRFEKLTGAGPSTGWVSLKLKDNPLVVKVAAVRHWEVVGGSSKGGTSSGGILVRAGHETDSAQEAVRLSTGAVVKELELRGNRLHYELQTGTGPEKGWVSLKQKDRDLLVRCEEVSAEALGTSWSQLEPPIIGRKVRILAVHSAPSNANIMKFQTVQLKKTLGKNFEWLYVEAPNLWECRETPPNHPEGVPVGAAWLLYGGKRSEMEERLAAGKPFLEWLRFDEDPRRPSPESAAKSLDYLRNFIQKEAPIDVVIALSQGSCIMAGLVEKFRSDGQPAPWRLSIFVSSVPPEAHYLAVPPQEPCEHPVIAVLGGEKDPWHAPGKAALPARYCNPTILEHEDGHAFPFTEPQAGKLYTQLASLIRAACGISE